MNRHQRRANSRKTCLLSQQDDIVVAVNKSLTEGKAMATARTPIKAEILSLLTSQPGVPAHVQTIAAALGETNVNRVASSLANIAKGHPETGVSRVAKGVYVFSNGEHQAPPATAEDEKPPSTATASKPSPASAPPPKRTGTPRQAKVVRKLTGDRLLIEASGELFVATRLEV